MLQFSLIVPVYNRPQEVEELLDSLLAQSDPDFEIILVEDGSSERCDFLLERYQTQLQLRYFFKQNSGPGLSRNYGAERAQGEYLIFLDSDCVLPTDYVAALRRFLAQDPVDAFGGPDRAAANFSPIQKAINYAMTSFFTTGGIRGGSHSVEKFHPRSFNMGFSQEVFQATGGFAELRFGEDIDMSIRMMQAGFRTALIPEAYVYHKRRTHFRQFFKQIFNSGIARINLYKRHPHSLKLLHFFPAAFSLGLLFSLILSLLGFPWLLTVYGLYSLMLFIDASFRNGNVAVGALSLVASFVQLLSYGTGFIIAFYRRILLGRGEFARFTRNFYR